VDISFLLCCCTVGDIVCAAILLFNDTAIHQNLFSLIFAVPSEWIITINCSVLSYLFAHICLNTISINRKEQRILQIMKVELIVTAIIMCSVVAIAEIGSYAATEFDLKLGMRLSFISICWFAWHVGL
jgi:hypothetical protein